MILVLSAVILTFTATLADAQNNQNSTYLSGLLQTLNNAGLTCLASAVGSVNSTSTGNQLLANLSNQKNNYTVFAPNNDAFSNAPSSATQDPNVLTDVVAYHVVFGHFPNVTDYPNTTIGRTSLEDSSVVMLEGNKSQVVAWARREDGQVHVLNQNRTNNPHISQQISYQNLNIYVIDGILDYPADINRTFQSNSDLTGFANLADNTDVPIWSTGDHTNKNTTVAEVLYGIRGLTLLVPSSQASIQEIPQISSNHTQLWAILRNHIINGTTVYSPSFVNSTHVSAAGQNLHFSSNSTGKFVTSGNTTARIVQPDVLTKNGVLHIIDRVLLNSEVNENAADHAYSSATELAGHSSTETGPVGVPTGGSNGSIGGVNGAVGNWKGLSVFGVTALSIALGFFFLFG
ncbi:FAS1 domain-containing protein [Thelephora ganbajun]|uniref:FAS1 domain-containing protein n=1 Tax=Thelephora ganbajun TaxID=370292 RepID=A0ACB6Z2R5_THEGA|nr:FAS1 domain-containing protein [Thelephora ganbajun]